MERIFCPACGESVEADGTFCPSCGKPLQQQSEPAWQAPPAPDFNNQQPNYGNAYVPQPGPMYEAGGKTGKGMGWIVFMRVILWLVFAGIVISGLVLGVEVMDYEAELGLAYIFGSILTGFLVVAGGMIALNNATNLRSIAMNTAKTVEILQEIRREK